MTSTPPPPPPYNPRQLEEKPPVVGWLIPVAGVLAIIGTFAPWFSPQGTLHGQVVLAAADNLHSWEDGKIGLIGPIALVLVSIGIVGLLTGRTVSRFERGSAGPVVTAARGAMIAGGVAIVAVVIAWFLVPGQYDQIPAAAGGSWDGAEKLGIDLSRGPQLGYWLTIAAAVVALVGGGLMLVLRNKPEPVAPPPPGAAPQGWAPPSAPGYVPPQQGWAQPPPPGQGPQQGWAAPPSPPPGQGPQQGWAAPPPPPPGQRPQQGWPPPPPPPGQSPQQGWAPPPPSRSQG